MRDTVADMELVVEGDGEGVTLIVPLGVTLDDDDGVTDKVAERELRDGTLRDTLVEAETEADIEEDEEREVDTEPLVLHDTDTVEEILALSEGDWVNE